MRPSLVDTLLRDPVVRRRIGLGLLLFTLVTALLVTLSPFRFHLRTASLSRIDWRLYYPGHSDRDLVLNLLMLAPLGAGLVLVRFGRASLSRIVLEACALGVGTALFIETLQIFERTRFPQAADVWRNGIGCIVGAVAVALVLRRIERRRQSSSSTRDSCHRCPRDAVASARQSQAGKEVGVAGDVVPVRRRDVGLVEDRVGGTFREARAAVDALVGIDEHLDARQPLATLRRRDGAELVERDRAEDAVARADVDARAVACTDALLGDHVGHASSQEQPSCPIATC